LPKLLARSRARIWASRWLFCRFRSSTSCCIVRRKRQNQVIKVVPQVFQQYQTNTGIRHIRCRPICTILILAQWKQGFRNRNNNFVKIPIREVIKLRFLEYNNYSNFFYVLLDSNF
jgi:hypothetical protein